MSDDETETILMFLKFGSESNINSLLENGTIYMKSIDWFRKHVDEFQNLRGDSYEGATRIINIPPGDFEIPSIGYKGSHLGIHLVESYETVLGNLYCLYCISSHGWKSPLEIKIDSSVLGFGTHCLMVKDNLKFLSLIENKLKSLNVKYRHGFVDYYDERQGDKKINLFEKRKGYENQKEFRIYVERDDTDDFSFQIGSLKDIAEVHPTEVLLNSLTFEKKDKNK